MRLATRHSGWPARVLVAALACLARTAAAEPGPDGSDDRDLHEFHEIRLAERDEARPGDARALSLTIAPRPGYSISRKGPLIIDVAAEPGAGIEVPRQRYLRRHAADAHADAPRFDLRYRAVSAGHHALRVRLRFWVCGDATCWPVRALRMVHIEVRSGS